MFAQAKELSDLVSVLVGIVRGGDGTLSHARPSRTAEAKGPATAAKTGKLPHISTGRPGSDWTPAPAQADRAASRNGRSRSAETVIPLADGELKDF
jgi:hypothetical protein